MEIAAAVPAIVPRTSSRPRPGSRLRSILSNASRFGCVGYSTTTLCTCSNNENRTLACPAGTASIAVRKSFPGRNFASASIDSALALSKVSEIAQSNNRLYSASGTYGAKKPMSSLREEKLVISSANESARGHSSAERYGAKPRRVSFRARFWKSSSSPSSLSADAESIANTERLARVPSETSGTNLARAKARVYPSGSCRHSLSTWSNNPGDLPSPRFDIASPIS